MTFADWYDALQQAAPFFTVFAFAVWMRRDYNNAMREIQQLRGRVQHIEAHVKPVDAALLEAPTPLPGATARYRS